MNANGLAWRTFWRAYAGVTAASVASGARAIAMIQRAGLSEGMIRRAF